MRLGGLWWFEVVCGEALTRCGSAAEAGTDDERTSVLNFSKLVCVVGWFIRLPVRPSDRLSLSLPWRCLTMQIMNAKYC